MSSHRTGKNDLSDALLKVRSQQERLTTEIVRLATLYGRYGQEQDNSTPSAGRLESESQDE